MKMFELLPRPLGSIFRKLTHLTCNSPSSRVVRNSNHRSCALGAGLPSIVRLCFGQPCSPCESGRFRRPSPRSAYTYTPSGASPAVIVSLSKVPPGWRPETKPRSAPSGAGLTSHAFVSRFGEKRDSSRALHPPSAARYFVGGIPPSRLVRVRWRITRTGVLPFPCARSLHMRR